MTTICSKCGSSLAADVLFCPQCGTPTSSYYSESGASPYEPTTLKPPSQIPSTDYGSPLYGAPSQNPYEPLNPYEAPPPPRQRLGLRVVLTVVIAAFVILVSAIGLDVVSHNQAAGVVAATATIPHQVTGSATATASSITVNPYGGGGTLTLDDPLRDNSQGNGWVENAPNSIGGCMFTGGAYHGSLDKGYYTTCLGVPSFKNFAMEAQITVLKGDCGGIIFRADNAGHHYLFEICPNGGYGVYLYFGSSGNDYKTLHIGNSQAIRTGFNQMNLIAAVAVNQEIRLFVNRQLVYQMTDKSYGMGQCGFAVDSSGAIVGTAAPTEVVFENLKVWTL
jgi:hypothetical protein